MRRLSCCDCASIVRQVQLSMPGPVLQSAIRMGYEEWNLSQGWSTAFWRHKSQQRNCFHHTTCFVYSRAGFSHTLANTALPRKLKCSTNTLLVYAVSLVVLSLSWRWGKNKNIIKWAVWYKSTLNIASFLKWSIFMHRWVIKGQCVTQLR